jgi:carboxymethylenebutenolidase
MMIELTAADGHRFGAYSVGPADATKALVVVQEIFGVNRHMRRICDDFAKQGYAVIAPALFDRVERDIELGYTGDDVARGRDLRAKVPADGPMLDVEACAAALPAGAARGIVGYCWGGTVAWWGATRSSSFKAACGWYGGGIAGTREETPNCAVELHFGSADASIPMSDVALIRAAQPGVAIFVYEGAGHGFGCEDRSSYKPDDAALADQRTLAFFAQHLG